MSNDMSYNTIDGNPPMSLATGGTNVIPQMTTLHVPTAIVQHPEVQAAVQKAMQDVTSQQQMAQAASQMPKADDRTQQMIANMDALRKSGAFTSPQQMFEQQHPIRSKISNALLAMGQSLTGAPTYTTAMNNQAEMQKQSMDMLGNAARYGQLTPEQQFMNSMRVDAANDRQGQRDQANWSSFINKVNPSTASSRSTVGMTANGNLRADRALATMKNNPAMTYQDLGNVIGDLAGIYQGGAPTDMGMKHQQYDTIQSRFANMQQFLTGNPQDAVPPGIKAKIMDTINSLKAVNNAALKNHLDSMEQAQKGLISKHSDEWQQYRKQIENDYMGGSTQQSASGNTPFEVGGSYNGHKILSVQKVK